jgi:FixJ family two-component response regulator
MMPDDSPATGKNAPVGLRISVVDDDASLLRSVGRLLRTAGCTVETFASPREFLSAHRQPSPQCLVLDVHLPEMTGFQLHEALVAQGWLIPVVFVTAYDSPQTRERARRVGACGLLLKPFDKQALLRAIHEAVGDGPQAGGTGEGQRAAA